MSEQHETPGAEVNPSERHPSGEYPPIEYVVKVKKRTPIQRLGCGLLILLWLLVMMIPFALLVLATQGSITIGHGEGIPNRHEHPLLQISLIMEIDYRGFSITNSTMNYPDESSLCIQTNVRYLLWQGEGDPATFCDCYTRPDPEAEWTLTGTTMGACE